MISMEEKIAIVIPAYKCRFLRQTLDSIVVQPVGGIKIIDKFI